jgi:hypothetical protein
MWEVLERSDGPDLRDRKAPRAPAPNCKDQNSVGTSMSKQPAYPPEPSRKEKQPKDSFILVQ